MRSSDSASILWQRTDRPGHEAAWLRRAADGWRLTGTAVFLERGQPCALEYAAECDAGWRTVSAAVTGWTGDRQARVELRVGGDGRWLVNGDDCPAVTGCVDVDFGFSPSTNLLPIRRLQLAIGEAAAVRAAWLAFPSFDLQPLEQVYRRTGENTYGYESRAGAFRTDIDVDRNGFVLRYPGLWQVVARDPVPPVQMGEGAGLVRPVEPGDRAEWLRMRAALWPGAPMAEHEWDIEHALEQVVAAPVFVHAREDGGLCGFLELSIRSFAEGCTPGAVPYVEGWWVDPDRRGAGVGRALVQAAEHWARARGYRELASDTEMANTHSHRAHLALGFHPVEQAILFRKALE